MADFAPAIDVLLRDEGGYTNDPHDSGNWTGGAVGAGVLKGTKYGISAASFSGEDIPNLTVDRAKQIYFRDWWNKGFPQINDQGVATKVFDLAVNMQRYGNKGPAIEILQKAICACGQTIPIDGALGPNTIAAANEIAGNQLLDAVRQEAVEYYETLVQRNPALSRYLNTWKKRALA